MEMLREEYRATYGSTGKPDHYLTVYGQPYPRLTENQPLVATTKFSKCTSTRPPSYQRARYSLPMRPRTVSRNRLDGEDTRSLLLGPNPQTLAKQSRWLELIGLSRKLQVGGFGPLSFPGVTKLASAYGDIPLLLSNNIPGTSRLRNEPSTSEHDRPLSLTTTTHYPPLRHGRAKDWARKQAFSLSTRPERADPYESHGVEILPVLSDRPRHNSLGTSNINSIVSEPRFPSAEHNVRVPLQSNPCSKGDTVQHKTQTHAGGGSSSSQYHGQRSSAGKRGRQSSDSPSRRKRPTKSGGRPQSTGNGHTNRNEDEDGEESETFSGDGKGKNTKSVRSRKIGIFACPFSKHNRNDYEECCGHSLGAYHQVFIHIKRKHNIEVPVDKWQCYRCKTMFQDKDVWSAHAKPRRCEEIEGELVPTVQLLHDKIRLGSNEEKWVKMYGLLFPGEEASPYTWQYDLRLESSRKEDAMKLLAMTMPSRILKTVMDILRPVVDENLRCKLEIGIEKDVVSQFKQEGMLDLQWVKPNRPPAYDPPPRPEPSFQNSLENLENGVVEVSTPLHDPGPFGNSQRPDPFMGAGAQFDSALTPSHDFLQPWQAPSIIYTVPELLQPASFNYPPMAQEPSGEYLNMMGFNDASSNTIQPQSFNRSIAPSSLLYEPDGSQQTMDPLKPPQDSGYRTLSRTTQDLMGDWQSSAE